MLLIRSRIIKLQNRIVSDTLCQKYFGGFFMNYEFLKSYRQEDRNLYARKELGEEKYKIINKYSIAFKQ